MRSLRFVSLGAVTAMCGCLTAQAGPDAVEASESAVPTSYTVRAGEAFAAGVPERLTFTTRGLVLNAPNWLNRADAAYIGPPTPPEMLREDGGPERGGCDFTNTYSGADFASGGSLFAQAGMAQGEWAAVQFVVPAGHFPVRIRLSEMLWATLNATTPTTTRYTIRWYSGSPATGTPIEEFSSDGVILPNISLPIGTSAVNVAVLIDAQDPEQIIIPAPIDGSNSFTVAFQITQHNNPSANPCLIPTPTASNAFPTTDTNGLSEPTRNWLFGVNCGLFGCPANGGWAQFENLPAFCRPSGDWNIRVSYELVNCGPASGACCFSSGTCLDGQTASACTGAGGTYRGDNTLCSGVTCVASTQACCFASTQTCLDLTPTNCTGFGGTLAGSGTSCASFVCFPIGACCLPIGTCLDGQSPAQCSSQGGIFRGNATTCATENCPPPLGACCGASGFCAEFSQTNCANVGGSWKGPLTTCADTNNNGTADACEALLPCPGDFNNDRQRNTPDLTFFLGRFGSTGTPPGFPGDMNSDGAVNTADLTQFLGVFGVACP
ncbi:MAG: hypothetical protein ACKVZJ_13685 [Phycisphaerales bacterium]